MKLVAYVALMWDVYLTYPMIHSSFLYGAAVVPFMFFRSLTHQADGLLVLLTEEFEFLTVQTAEHIRPCSLL